MSAILWQKRQMVWNRSWPWHWNQLGIAQTFRKVTFTFGDCMS